MSNRTDDQRYGAQLRAVATSHTSALHQEVATIILDCCEDDYRIWFEDLFAHGCISGMVGSLIYYTDTHAFFDRHYDQIEALREQYEDDTGAALLIRGDLKNRLAWFAFESVAMHIYEGLH